MKAEKHESLTRVCGYSGGCSREGTRPFPAEPVQGWLCEEHFHEVLNTAAEVAVAARHKFEAEWQQHLKEYLREHNLNSAELTEAQGRQVGEECKRWMKQRRSNA